MNSPENVLHLDNFVNVAGLKKKDSLLVIGNNKHALNSVKQFVSAIYWAKSPRDLKQLIIDEARFDRVFISSVNILTGPFILDAALLVNDQGLLALHGSDDFLRDCFVECIESSFPQADIWKFSSDEGSLILTNAHGVPAEY